MTQIISISFIRVFLCAEPYCFGNQFPGETEAQSVSVFTESTCTVYCCFKKLNFHFQASAIFQGLLLSHSGFCVEKNQLLTRSFETHPVHKGFFF